MREQKWCRLPFKFEIFEGSLTSLSQKYGKERRGDMGEEGGGEEIMQEAILIFACPLGWWPPRWRLRAKFDNKSFPLSHSSLRHNWHSIFRQILFKMKVELEYLQFYVEFLTFLFLLFSLSCPPDLKSPFVFSSSSSSSFPLFGQPKTHHHRSSSSQQQPWTDLLKSLTPPPLPNVIMSTENMCRRGEKKEGKGKRKKKKKTWP